MKISLTIGMKLALLAFAVAVVVAIGAVVPILMLMPPGPSGGNATTIYMIAPKTTMKSEATKSTAPVPAATTTTTTHSLIRGVPIQSCSAGAKNFTKCVFYHVQFSGVIQNIAYHRAIKTKF